MENQTTVNQRLSEAMQQAATTQSKIAELIGTSQAAVSQWVAGKKLPTSENLTALAQALGVRRQWFEFGTGSIFPVDFIALRKEYRMKSRWGFRPAPADGGRDYGNANVWAFDPTLEALVREVLQNVRDAAFPSGSRVEVAFKIVSLKGAALVEFLKSMRWAELSNHLKSSVTTGQKLGHLLQAGLRQLDESDELLLLIVEDRGTSGLTGEEKGKGNFAALCRNNLDSNKQSQQAGGAFGLGKAVLWRASLFATVMFCSTLAAPTAEGKQSLRVLGRCDLPWHDVGGSMYAGPGWFGSPDATEEGHVVSYWENEALAEDLHLRRADMGPGTSICVVGFHDPSADTPKTPRQLAKELEDAAAKWFWPAIANGLMSVSVETFEADKQTSKADVDVSQLQPEFVSLLGDYREGGLDDALVNEGDVVLASIPLVVPERKVAEIHKELNQEAKLLVRRASDDSDSKGLNQLALFRGPSLVVKYLDLKGIVLGARPFHAALLCGTAAGDDLADKAADAFLRTAEPPAHNDWTSTPELKTDYARGGLTKLGAFIDAAKEKIRELVKPPSQDAGDGPQSIRELLRIGSEPTAGSRERPKVIRPRGEVDSKGRWGIEARIRVKADTRGYRITPVVLFNAETGGGQAVDWESLEGIGK